MIIKYLTFKVLHYNIASDCHGLVTNHWGVCLAQGMFQAPSQDPVLQHDAVHIQHGDNDEGEDQHPLLLPPSFRHGSLHGEESHPQRPTPGWVLGVGSSAVLHLGMTNLHSS